MMKKGVFKKAVMIISVILGVFILIVLGIGSWTSSPGYGGEKTDHFDGTKFLNGPGYEEKGFTQLLKWMTSRKPGEWTELLDKDVTFGPKPAARITDSTQVIIYVNHSTFLIQTDGLNILTDPVYSKRVSPFSFAGPKRMRPPGIQFDDLPEIDFVLLSHNHYDHLDIATIKRIQQKFDPTFITPLGVDLYLNKQGISNTISLDWWEETSASNSVEIAAVQAQHFSSRGMFDRDKTLWAGFVIKSPKGNIYFAGDTGYNDFFTEIGERYAPIKTALIPIGAYIPRWFMSPVHVDPAQAVQIHKDVKSEYSIGMHFGTFPLADDGHDDPINDFNKAVGDEQFILLGEGEKIIRD
tara:strand:+ start:30778 stop:31836 length:1059 start_codon:yes stop_codon:yes gene_type:complete